MADLLDDGFEPIKKGWFSDKKQLAYSLVFLVLEVLIMYKATNDTLGLRSFLDLSPNNFGTLSILLMFLLLLGYKVLSLKQLWEVLEAIVVDIIGSFFFVRIVQGAVPIREQNFPMLVLVISIGIIIFTHRKIYKQQKNNESN